MAETLLRKASVNNTLIHVNIPDIPWNGKALLREVQTHPWRGTPYHISFFAVSEHSALEVDVPLHFVGTATGVKVGGGALEPILTSLHVKCIANSIPEHIEVDVTNLEVGDALHVHQLTLPEGVISLGEPDRVVVSIMASRGDAEESAE
jgi:large subunit ribosomal protein L25